MAGMWNELDEKADHQAWNAYQLAGIGPCLTDPLFRSCLVACEIPRSKHMNIPL